MLRPSFATRLSENLTRQRVVVEDDEVDGGGVGYSSSATRSSENSMVIVEDDEVEDGSGGDNEMIEKWLSQRSAKAKNIFDRPTQAT